MPVSVAQVVTLAAGGEVDVIETPCVITSVIVTEATGTAAAAVSLSGHGDMATLMSFGVAAGQTVVWSGEPVAAGSGIVVACPTGDATVMVAYR